MGGEEGERERKREKEEREWIARRMRVWRLRYETLVAVSHPCYASYCGMVEEHNEVSLEEKTTRNESEIPKFQLLFWWN